MGETYDIRKLGGDKIALLGLFALSLLTARLVVGLKSALVLSAPIPLAHTGLSASVPTGNGWQTDGRWQSDRNVHILTSSFAPGSGERTAWVMCRYLPAGMATAQMRFEQKAREFGGNVVEMNKLRTATLVFEWAHIRGGDRRITVFVGTTILPDGRQFDVEVREGTGDAEQAEKAFKEVVESVRFEDSRLRAAAPRTT